MAPCMYGAYVVRLNSARTRRLPPRVRWVGGADDAVVGVDHAEVEAAGARSQPLDEAGDADERVVVGLQHVLERDVRRRPRERSHHLLRDLAVAVLDGEEQLLARVQRRRRRAAHHEEQPHRAPPLRRRARRAERAVRVRPCVAHRLPPPPRLKLGLPRREHEREHVVRQQLPRRPPRPRRRPPTTPAAAGASDDGRSRPHRRRPLQPRRRRRPPPLRRRRRVVVRRRRVVLRPRRRRRSRALAARCAGANFGAHPALAGWHRAARFSRGGGGDGDDCGDGRLGAAAVAAGPAGATAAAAAPSRRERGGCGAPPLSAASSGSCEAPRQQPTRLPEFARDAEQVAGQDEAGDRPEAHGARKPHGAPSWRLALSASSTCVSRSLRRCRSAYCRLAACGRCSSAEFPYSHTT